MAGSAAASGTAPILGGDGDDVIRVEGSVTFAWVPNPGTAAYGDGSYVYEWEEYPFHREGPSTASGTITFRGVASSEFFSATLLPADFTFTFTAGPAFDGLAEQGLDSGTWSWDPEAGVLVAGEAFTAWDNWIGLWIGTGAVNISTSHWSGYSSDTEFGHWALVADPRDAVVRAGAGNDAVFGGQGRQSLFGGAGDDALRLGRGDDGAARGEDGDDALHGGTGAQVLDGGAGDDLLVGGRGAQTLRGGTGDDALRGGVGDQVLLGGAGDDRLWGGLDGQVLDGGEGHDVLLGGRGAQVLRGGGGGDELRAGVGDQALLGGAGDDVLWGGLGTQVLRGEAGRDVLHAGQGAETLFGGAGRDTFVFHAGSGGGGAATVADFRPGQDLVRLDPGDAAGDVAAHLRSDETGTAVLVGDGGATMTLLGITEAAARAHLDDWFVLAA